MKDYIISKYDEMHYERIRRNMVMQKYFNFYITFKSMHCITFININFLLLFLLAILGDKNC